MRLRKAAIRQRVNALVTYRFESTGLTSFAGLELIREYATRVGLASRLRERFESSAPVSDFSSTRLVLLIVALLLGGGRRVRHLDYLRHDPIVQRFSGLDRIPSRSTVSRWLASLEQRDVETLAGVNEQLVAETIDQLGLRRLTIDIDGSVVSTGQRVQWAQRGFNPHHRKVPSYYPITAYEAQSGQILRVKNRPGNVHDGKAGVPFLRSVLAQIERTLGPGYTLEFRMDGAFFRQDVLDLLDRERAEYAIKVPFWNWVGLKQRIQARTRWQRVDETVSYFEANLPLESWGRQARVVIYRKQVAHRSPKNYQLDLFDPSNGHFEYSAIVTNKRIKGQALWYFMCGRGTHEKVYAELKNGFAFDSLPSMTYGGNSAWQAMSVIAFNLCRGFQIASGAPIRQRTAKRSTLYRFQSIQTLRYELLNRAGQLLRPAGKVNLDVGAIPAVKNRFTTIVGYLRMAA